MRINIFNEPVAKAQKIAGKSAQDDQFNYHTARVKRRRDHGISTADLTLFQLPAEVRGFRFDLNADSTYSSDKVAFVRPPLSIDQSEKEAAITRILSKKIILEAMHARLSALESHERQKIETEILAEFAAIQAYSSKQTVEVQKYLESLADFKTRFSDEHLMIEDRELLLTQAKDAYREEMFAFSAYFAGLINFKHRVSLLDGEAHKRSILMKEATEKYFRIMFSRFAEREAKTRTALENKLTTMAIKIEPLLIKQLDDFEFTELERLSLSADTSEKVLAYFDIYCRKLNKLAETHCNSLRRFVKQLESLSAQKGMIQKVSWALKLTVANLQLVVSGLEELLSGSCDFKPVLLLSETLEKMAQEHYQHALQLLKKTLLECHALVDWAPIDKLLEDKLLAFSLVPKSINTIDMAAEKCFFGFASAYYHYRYLLNVFSNQFSRELLSEIESKLSIALRSAYAIWTRFWDNDFPEKQYFLENPDALSFRADLSLTQRDLRNLLSQEQELTTKLIIFKLLPILTVSLKMYLPDCLAPFLRDNASVLAVYAFTEPTPTAFASAAATEDAALYEAIFAPEEELAEFARPFQ